MCFLQSISTQRLQKFNLMRLLYAFKFQLRIGVDESGFFQLIHASAHRSNAETLLSSIQTQTPNLGRRRKQISAPYHINLICLVGTGVLTYIVISTATIVDRQENSDKQTDRTPHLSVNMYVLLCLTTTSLSQGV